MAIAIGGHAEVHAGSGSALTTAGVTTQASGSTFLIVVASTSASITVSDNKGNTYTALASAATGTVGVTLYLTAYYSQNGVGGTGHTASVNANGVNLFFAEVTGGLTTGILDLETQLYDTSSPYQPGAISIAQSAELLYSVMVSDTGSNPATNAPGTGYTLLDNQTNGASYWVAASAYQVTSSTGSYNPSWTSSGSTDALVMQVALKASGGGGATVSLKRNTLMNGLGSSGPFFNNPLG